MKTTKAYHGTNNTFDAFDFSYLGSASGNGAGSSDAFFFTASRDEAAQYAADAVAANGGEPIVLAVEIELTNPLTIDLDIVRESRDIVTIGDVDVNPNNPLGSDTIRMAADLDYDGIIFVGAADNEYGQTTTQAAVWDEDQITIVDHAIA